MKNRTLIAVFVAFIALFVLGAIWCGVSIDWDAVADAAECQEHEENCDTSVRSGSKGHGRGYYHGGKY